MSIFILLDINLDMNKNYLVFSVGKCDYLIAFDNKNVEALKETFRNEVNFEIITLDNFLPKQ